MSKKFLTYSPANGKSWSFIRNFAKGHKLERTKDDVEESVSISCSRYFCFSATVRRTPWQDQTEEPRRPERTLEKMIVASGSVMMDVDLNRLNDASSATANRETLHFALAADSFFTILAFNKVLRGPVPGSIALIPQNSANLPARLSASLHQLVVEKLPSVKLSISSCATAKAGSSFSISKDINTITMPGTARSRSMMAGF